jgi:protein TonB
MAADFGAAEGASPAQDLPAGTSARADVAGPRCDADLFSRLPGSAPTRIPLERGAALSVLAHVLALAVAILAPLASLEAPPVERDAIRVLIYDPPPPPPPPLPKGPGLTRRLQTHAPESPAPRPSPAFTAPVQEMRPDPAPSAPEPSSEAGGSPTGSEQGVPEGMEGGQVGGVVGGVPGGVLGGVIGGTGDIPVPVAQPDRAPRLLRLVKPEYPQDAFVKKVQGVVYVEILIDANGRVVRTRVTRSIPLLDEAAVAAVRQWMFAPAVKAGRPVATLAMAPVTFTLY